MATENEQQTIFACFEAIRGDPDFDALALLTYDEEFANKWVEQYPYTIHPLEKCPSCGRWGTAADVQRERENEENSRSSEGRWYTPWRIDVVCAPLDGADGRPEQYSVNNNQMHLHILPQDKVLVKQKK